MQNAPRPGAGCPQSPWRGYLLPFVLHLQPPSVPRIPKTTKTTIVLTSQRRALPNRQLLERHPSLARCLPWRSRSCPPCMLTAMRRSISVCACIFRASAYRGSLRTCWNAALVRLIVEFLHVGSTLVYCLVSRSRVPTSHQQVSGGSTKDNGGTHGPGCIGRLAASVAGSGSPSSGCGCADRAGGPGNGRAESGPEHVDSGCVDGLIGKSGR